jgi:hypothetical protein
MHSAKATKEVLTPKHETAVGNSTNNNYRKGETIPREKGYFW